MTSLTGRLRIFCGVMCAYIGLAAIGLVLVQWQSRSAATERGEKIDQAIKANGGGGVLISTLGPLPEAVIDEEAYKTDAVELGMVMFGVLGAATFLWSSKQAKS